MFLKCETTLNVYEHNHKKILCRVKVLPLIDNKTNGNGQNTCRSITEDQWNEFDKELKSWLALNETNVCKTDEVLCRFSVKPNLQVKLRKSYLVKKDFLICANMDDEGACELEDDKYFSYVLDCILEFTSMLPPTPTLNTDEYEPLPTGSTHNNTTISPLSYAPYTPSKRNRRFHSEYHVKTPGFEILGCETVEDRYSPKPIGKISTTSGTAQYNPAPIEKRSASLESQLSNLNEVIIETDDERLPYEEYRSIRTRLNSRTRKKDLGEYVPQTQLIDTNIPDYKPTPIEAINKSEKEKKPKSNEELSKEQKEKRESVEKDRSEGNKSKDHKKKEKRKSKENDIENKKENKRTSSPKESKQSLNSTFTSEDEFESALNKQHARDKKKDKHKTKVSSEDAPKTDKTQESINKDKRKAKNIDVAAKTDKTQESQKGTLKSPTQIQIDSLLSSYEGEHSSNIRKHQMQNKDNRMKDKEKDKRKPKEYDEVTKINEKKSSQKEIQNSPEDKQEKISSHSIRRSERSPSKPKRLIEEQENYKSRKKIRSERSSPIKNKELFGSDEDDDEDVVVKRSDSNNNGSKKHSGFHTPKPDKRNTSGLSLSASPSSSTKKKRKRHDCEQEKAGMSKWLCKKGSSKESSGDTRARSSTEKSSSSSSREKSSSSSKDKSSKKLKSSREEKRERCKSASPQTVAIVMPSKEELEAMRNKHKLQREENEKVKAALEKISVPSPKKVEQLSLKDMDLNELLDSFSEYKKYLDEIFDKNNKKDYVKGNDGINHCLVIGLIEQRLQLKMLEKLSDYYSSTNNTATATLYANALLPEWIIRIFMERYQLSRHQAIDHIQDQDAYRSYIDGQNENSLLFED